MPRGRARDTKRPAPLSRLSGDPRRLLGLLLALDRRVVELSMHIYGIPREDQFRMRAQSRRLHTVLKGSRLTSLVRREMTEHL